MNEPETQLLAEMIRGARLIFDNATALYDEAQLLGTNGRFARALTLHQLSMEECSKIEMLGASVTSVFMGNHIDLDKLAIKFRQHKVKNYSNAYVSETTEAEAEARKRGDVAGAVQIFKDQQAKLHELLNTNKNASLYVDYEDGKFVSPSEKITEEMAAHIRHVNAFFLRHASSNLDVLKTMTDDPGTSAARAKDLTGRLAQLMATEGVDFEEKFDEIVGGWMEEEVEKARRVSETPSKPPSSST